VLGTLGLFGLLWVMSVWMKGVPSNAYKNVFDGTNNETVGTVKQYWRTVVKKNTPTAKDGYDNIRTVYMEEDTTNITHTAEMCTYLATQRPFGKGYRAHLKELESLCYIDTNKDGKYYVEECVKKITTHKGVVKLIIVPDGHNAANVNEWTGTQEKDRKDGVYWVTIQSLLSVSDGISWKVDEIHFVQPPSIQDYECVTSRIATSWMLSGIDIWSVNININTEYEPINNFFSRRVVTKVYQYVRTYQKWTKWLGPFRRHVRGIHSPDELLVDRYKDASREWKAFTLTLDKPTHPSKNKQTLTNAVGRIRNTYRDRLDTMKTALLSSSNEEDNDEYLLGFFRARMQEYEQKIRNKQLEKEWATHQLLDDEALEKKLYKNMSSAFRQTFANHTNEKKRTRSAPR